MTSIWKGTMALVFILLTSVGGLLAFEKVAQTDSITMLIEQAQKNTYKKPEHAALLAKQAYQMAKINNQVIAQGEALRILGGTFYIRGDYDLALGHFLEAFQVFENVKDTLKMTRILSNLGLVYKNLEDYEKSLTYYYRGLQYTNQNDSFTLSKIYNNLGVVHKRKQNSDSAIYYFSKSLILKEGIADLKGVANTLTNLGNIEAEKGKNVEAIPYFRRSLILERELGHDEGIAKNMNNIGKAYWYLTKVDSAIYYSRIGYEIGLNLKTKVQIKESAEVLAAAYAAKKNYKLAFDYQQIHMQYGDSLSNEDVSRKIGRLESKLELARQQAEIDRLTLVNKLQESNLRASKIQIIWISVFCLIIVLAAAIIYLLRARAHKIEQLVQASQLEALQKRYMELINGPSTYDLTLDLKTLNKRLVNELTEREYEILQCSLNGMTNKEVADKLFVSLSTIKFHLGNVYNKFGVNNKKEALEYVVKTS